MTATALDPANTGRRTEGLTPTQQKRATLVLAGWGLSYALYRGYYAAGGTVFLAGTLADPSEFRAINATAVVILLAAAALPLAALPMWPRRRPRVVLLAVFWVIAVGCSVHAMIDGVQRVLSLAGLHDVRYPASVWASIDTRAADLQDLCFNEPWFLFEGLGFALLAWVAMGHGTATTSVDRQRRRRDRRADGRRADARRAGWRVPDSSPRTGPLRIGDGRHSRTPLSSVTASTLSGCCEVTSTCPATTAWTAA